MTLLFSPRASLRRRVLLSFSRRLKPTPIEGMSNLKKIYATLIAVVGRGNLRQQGKIPLHVGGSRKRGIF